MQQHMRQWGVHTKVPASSCFSDWLRCHRNYRCFPRCDRAWTDTYVYSQCDSNANANIPSSTGSIASCSKALIRRMHGKQTARHACHLHPLHQPVRRTDPHREPLNKRFKEVNSKHVGVHIYTNVYISILVLYLIGIV